MFIGICGSICAGKSTVAQYLVEHHGFKRLRITARAAEDGCADQAPATNGVAVAAQSSRKTHGTAAPLNSLARRAIEFPDAAALLDFVTKRWRERWVMTIGNLSLLDLLSRRPFFILISVDAPVTVRWRRYIRRQKQREELQHQRDHTLTASHESDHGAKSGGAGGDGDGEISLSSFVERSDAQLFDALTGQMALMSRAAAQLLNTSSDIAHLFATLGKVDLPDEERLRPSWDNYFMSLASLAAQRSNCMKRRVGCVLVHERRIVSTGYNGTPRGLRNCGEGGCGRCNEGLSSGVGLATCLCIHAEENALLEAGRNRIHEGSTLYCDTCPCLTCSIKIAQVGISEVVYSQGYSMDGETAAVLREAGVRLRQFVPPANGLIHLEKTELYD